MDKTRKRTEMKMPVEVYSRVVGYFRPVNQWNEGKRAEFEDRKPADVAKLLQEMRA